jgi:hypothetical protein
MFLHGTDVRQQAVFAREAGEAELPGLQLRERYRAHLAFARGERVERQLRVVGTGPQPR